ncbi:MAG: ABC transporter permease [Actinomycetota bacterium]
MNLEEGPALPPRKSSLRPPKGLVVFASASAVIFAGPLCYLVIRSAQEIPAIWSSLRGDQIWGPLGRSLGLATAVCLTAGVVGTGAGWLVGRTAVPGRRLWAALLPLPLAIPSYVATVAFLAAMGPGGLLAGPMRRVGFPTPPIFKGFWASLLLFTLITYPYVYLPVAARVRQLDPSLEEAAKLLGRRPTRVFFSIVIPQIKAAIAAGALLVFLYTLSDFGAVQLLRYDTLTRAIYANRLFNQPLSIALSLMLALLALLIVGIQRGMFKQPTRQEGRRAVDPGPRRLGRSKWPSAGGLAVLLLVALILPLAVLGFWAIRGVLAGSTRQSSIVGNLGALLEPGLNTGVAALATAVVAILVAAPIAVLNVRFRSHVGRVANGLIVGGFALPGLAIALALTFWTLRGPGIIGAAYQTLPLLILAYVIHFGAQTLGSSEVAVASVPQKIADAARVLGAGRFRRILKVEGPLMLPGMVAGGGLVLLSVMKELPATLLLSPPGFQTLATKIWGSAEDGFLADASISSIVLVILSGVLTWLLVIRPARL